MNTLKIEGQKYNIHSNAITPVAFTRMTDGLIPADIGKNLQPEYVTPAVIFLASEDAPNGAIISAGLVCFLESSFMKLKVFHLEWEVT